MKRILLRAIAIGRRADRLKDSTLLPYRAELERRRDAITKLWLTNRHGIRLRKRYAKMRFNLFVFINRRKGTNGFRSRWGDQLFARFPGSSTRAKGRPPSGPSSTLAAKSATPNSKPSASHLTGTPYSCQRNSIGGGPALFNLPNMNRYFARWLRLPRALR